MRVQVGTTRTRKMLLGAGATAVATLIAASNWADNILSFALHGFQDSSLSYDDVVWLAQLVREARAIEVAAG